MWIGWVEFESELIIGLIKGISKLRLRKPRANELAAIFFFKSGKYIYIRINERVTHTPLLFWIAILLQYFFFKWTHIVRKIKISITASKIYEKVM